MYLRGRACFTPEKYLETEAGCKIRHEFIHGLMVAMPDANKAHSVIKGNLLGLLWNHLRGSECSVYASDTKVRLLDGCVFYYPDLVATADEQDNASKEGCVSHPKLVVEVLSDLTESVDHGEKFENYQTILELEEYVLVHQKQMVVERFSRHSNGLWRPQVYSAGDQLELASVGFSCPIEFLYENAEQFLERYE
jgi:Uma2 family endonuclease